MTARLEVRDATVRFPTAVALDAVDLDVAAAETVVVLGPSGSGKSTLLRAIAGLQALDTGHIALDGTDLAAVPPHRRGVGLMFQDQALFPHLDVGGNVGFGLRMQRRGHDEIRRRVADLLDLVGLPGTASRAVRTLSGGEQQRVALARALAPRPGVLLLDEPLGALDRPLRERLVGELRTLFARLGQTIVAVTHDHAEAFALADRIVVVDRGRVLQAGSPAAVWEAPGSAQVARLLGFGNVAPASVANGMVQTPWGELGPAPTGTAAVLVRADGVHLDPQGPLEVTVRRVTFGGARSRLDLAVSGAPDLEADVASPDAPAIGSVLRARVDPTAVQPLPG